jgi:hypothetical protein
LIGVLVSKLAFSSVGLLPAFLLYQFR